MARLSSWIKISLVLSVFGFLKEFRPSEPYVYEYLTGSEWHNLNGTIVQQDVYPVTTYSYGILLVFVFLLTDYCRYKPFITLSTISGIIIWSMLIWAHGLLAIQTLEVFYGFFMAAEVAYYTYIYAKVSKEHYQIVTSYTRTAILLGRFTSAAIAQTLVYFEIFDFKQLNYLSLSGMILATLWSFLLPPVPRSLYFHQDLTNQLSPMKKTKKAFQLLYNHFKTSYSSFTVIKWSLWSAMATCGFIQVESYIQPLWQIIITENNSKEGKNIYNALITATLTLLSAAMSVLAGICKINWDYYGELALTVCSSIGGCALILCALTPNIWVCYVAYICFGVLYQLMMTVANYKVASAIPEDSYGLIFGINTLLGLVFQTVLIQVVVSDHGFAFKPKEQYLVYGGYHLVIGFIFCMFMLKTFMAKRFS